MENIIQQKDKDVIDLRVLFKKLWCRKKLFYKVWPITFVVSALIIVSVPRTYTCEIMLAPESNTPSAGGMLGSLASSFGFDLSTNLSTDAIYPTLYPDLMGSTDFLVGLFDVKVKTFDGTLETDYYTYLTQHQKIAWWSYPGIWIGNLLSSVLPSDDSEARTAVTGSSEVPSSFMLSKTQMDVAEKISSNISCGVDKKTDVITIVVEDQDKLICATMADSVRMRLQDAITNYRTKKARIDYEYYAQLTENAKLEYEKTRQLYVRLADANVNVTLTKVKSEIEDVENDMQIKYSTYNAMNTQMQAAKAKVQERTPAFTILQSSTVPVKPTGPKRMVFVLAMLFLATFVTMLYVIKDDLIQSVKS